MVFTRRVPMPPPREFGETAADRSKAVGPYLSIPMTPAIASPSSATMKVRKFSSTPSTGSPVATSSCSTAGRSPGVAALIRILLSAAGRTAAARGLGRPHERAHELSVDILSHRRIQSRPGQESRCIFGLVDPGGLDGWILEAGRSKEPNEFLLFQRASEIGRA